MEDNWAGLTKSKLIFEVHNHRTAGGGLMGFAWISVRLPWCGCQV